MSNVLEPQVGGSPAPAPAAAVNAVATGPDAEAQALIARYDREAKALGNVPAAAPLFHEMGLLWEQPLKSPRNAAICYQNAFRLDPAFVPNVRSARRLFAEVGNWQMAVQLLDAEIAATQAPEARASLQLEKGQLLEDRLAHPDEALAAYEQGLQESPGDLALLCQLESLYAARGEDEKLLGVLLRLAEAVPDEALRAHYLYAASVACEDRLNRPEQAAELLDRAFVLRRRDPVLLSAMKRRAERSGSDDFLLKALAAEAENLREQSGPAYYRISRIYERLGRAEDAIGALQAARHAAPNDPLILSELSRLHENLGRWEDLAEVLAARAASLADQGEKAALNLRLAALFEERLKRDDEAIARYQAVVAIQPGHQLALASLGKLFFRRQDWAGLLSTHEAEAAAIEDPKLRVAPLYRAAEILEQRLGREDEAVGRYSEILQLAPGYLPAQKALIRLYEKRGRYAELTAIYEQEVAQTRDRDQMIATLMQVAIIYEEHLSDLDRAAGALRRILDAAPEHLPTIRALARLHERAGKWDELIKVNDLEASLTGDTKHVMSLLHRNAEIQEEKLGNPEAAIETYKKVLALNPSYLPGLKALGRLYAARQRFEDLIQMYRQEAEIAPSIDQAASLTYKIGEIHEDKLKDLDAAVAAYQEVLTLSPSHFAALRALSRIHRAHGAWENLIEVLRAEAAARTDPGERANTLFQVAAIWEDASRLDLAVDAYQEVLRISPSHAVSHRALERIYLEQGATKDLVALHERETQTAASPEDKVAAYAKLARLYLTRLDEPARASACFEAILAIEPNHLDALKGLERARAQDRARRVDLRRRLAAQIQASALSAYLLAAAAQDLERLGQHDEALALWKQAHALQPSPRTAGGLESALTRAADLAGLATLLEEQQGRETRAPARASLAMRIGRIALQQGDLPRALTAYAAALQADPRSIPALRAARHVFLLQGDFKSARQGLQAEAAATCDRGEAVSAWYESGLVALDRLGDPDGATADFQKALELDPLAAGPAAKLEDLLARRGGDASRAALHVKRGEAKLAQRQNDEAARELLEAAQLFAAVVGDLPSAIGAAERALAAVPNQPAVLSLLGDLCLRAGRHADAARALAARAEQGGAPAELAAVHLRLGVLYQDHLQAPDRAAAHLQAALTGAPDNVEALDRLARIHLAGRNWSAAGGALQRLMELDRDDPKRLAAHTLALARVLDEGFGDAARASQLYRRVLELVPGDGAVLDRLAALYERMGNGAELAAMLEQQAQGSRDPAQVAALRAKAGALHVRLGDTARAVASYRFAIEANPASLESHAALAGILAREPGQTTAAIESYRQVIRIDPFRADAYHALFRLFDAAKQVDRQFCAASVLTFLRQATELEALFAGDARLRAPQDTAERLADADLDALLAHPGQRGPWFEVLRLIGAELSKLYPADLDGLGIGRGDRLKPDHALAKPLRSICASLGVERYEVYQGKRGAGATVENTDPQSVVIGPDVVRKYQTRDQRFLFARAALVLRNHTVLAQRLSPADLGQLLGAAVRAVQPEHSRVGTSDVELVKRVRKSLPGKVLKGIEAMLPELERGAPDMAALARSIASSGDRAGLVYSGDIPGALQLLAREDPRHAANRLDSAEAVRAAAGRPELHELMIFCVSDDFFRLRQKLKMGLGS